MENPATLAEACRTLAKSYELSPRGDTLLNLAECHRREGKTATAWREFDEAIRHGAQVGYADAVKVARTYRDDLVSKLSRLTVTVPAETAALEGLGIEVRGKPLARDQWDEPTPIDPGPLEVTAVAKGHVAFRRQIVIGPEADSKTVVVKLERVPLPTALPPKPGPAAPAPEPRPVWPWAVGGVGLGLLGASVAFGIDAVAAGKNLDDRCGPERTACPVGYDHEAARSRELASFGLFVGFGAGGLVALGAAALGLGLSGGSNESEAMTSLSVSPSSFTLLGRF